ncbi:putative Rhs Core protein [Escherichia coli]|nr:putative Rhs Core protein [Escherichia coli]
MENPETGELLWQHETKHAYNEQGLANRVTPDSLPPVEWLTYGSGYLAGMKLGGTPLVEYTRDRLHRETVRSFGSRAGSNAAYELTSTYTPAGQLQSQHLNSLVYDRDYGWNDNGDLVRISGPRQTREYGYSATGRLESVRTLAPGLDIRIPYATDPAGNRLPDPELHPDSTLTAWPDNRIAEDAHYVYHYDEYGRLTEKTDRIPTGVIRTDDERTHHYHYDSQHRLVFHTRIQHGEPLVESRYLYDPLGRRMAKRVWRRERDLTGWMSLSRKPEETWYGWDGDRLTTVQTDTTRIQTVYQPGSFTPLIRVETENGEREKAQRRSLAEKLQQEGSEDGHGVVFPAELVRLLDRLEEEIRADRVSDESRAWLTGERQTVENPETGELLWQHETKHAYNEQGLANRVTPDSLPPVEWLTYGSGYLAGMKLGGTPLVEYTRDRLHRETVRSFGSRAGSNAAYELTSTYTPAGQLQSQHLNSLVYDRDYGWNDNGDLVRISGPRQTREYGYSATGRLESVRTLAPDLDIRIPYATDPAGNRLPDPELHPDSTLTAWPDNRIAEDAHYVYHYDEYGRLTEKTDLIPAGVIRTDDERTHHYHYDSQHRLVFHTRIQHGEPLVESRYLYDPLGRRMAKRVWRRERDLTGWMSLSRKPEETWYGWDGDRLTTVQTDTTRIQTVYQPGSFTPLIRVETENGEREKAQRRSLAEKLQQEGSEDGHGVVFPAELVRLLDRLEEEIRADRVSDESRAWLAQCGLTVERLAAQIEPVYLPERKIHLYHCDHRGLPLALISEDGNTAWSAEYDEWGNQLNEENPHHLHQPYRLPGQQYDKESGLYYNRNRYYDPLQGRYITQDPIGLEGGMESVCVPAESGEWY